jgi:hypothetical protein
MPRWCQPVGRDWPDHSQEKMTDGYKESLTVPSLGFLNKGALRPDDAQATYELVSVQPEQIHNSLLRIEQDDPAA